jgi:hypothetical protein
VTAAYRRLFVEYVETISKFVTEETSVLFKRPPCRERLSAVTVRDAE